MTSSTVTTCRTPGSALAALVSTDLILPCATVLRNSLAYTMPGTRMVWVYSARPVTLSRLSRRGDRAADLRAHLARLGGGRIERRHHQCSPSLPSSAALIARRT